MKSFPFSMTPPKKPETKTNEPKGQDDAFKPVKKAASEITSEFHKVESTIKKLPVNRRTVFFLGLAMVVLAFLNIFGQWVTALLGVLVMYFSFTGKNPLDEGGK